MGILNPQDAGGDLPSLSCWLNLHPLGNEGQAEQEQREPGLLLWSVGLPGTPSSLKPLGPDSLLPEDSLTRSTTDSPAGSTGAVSCSLPLQEHIPLKSDLKELLFQWSLCCKNTKPLLCEGSLALLLLPCCLTGGNPQSALQGWIYYWPLASAVGSCSDPAG